MLSATVLKELARSFLAGAATVEAITDRSSRTLGRRWKWLRPLAQRYVERFGDRNSTRPRHREIVDFLRRDQGLRLAWVNHSRKIRVHHWLRESERMQPVPAARSWDVPAIESPGELARWLGINLDELGWFADLKGLGHRKCNSRLRHYHYQILEKLSGSIRLLEAPKLRLKRIQRQILVQILERIPPHPAVHGFIKHRSIRTFVAPHVGQRVVLRMDLQDFFPSYPAARIQTLFRTAGYPESVADLLGGICTNATPREVWKQSFPSVDRARLRVAQELYNKPHLPQGAPTSPALANLCAYRLDCRLSGLAAAAGATYTRYADDLAFSGDWAFERCVERFSIHVAAILLEEGFAANHRKTRIMRQGVRQHLAGLVANQDLNVIRADFDRLKATLTNCVRRGPESQNREAHPDFRAHLEGRVGFVEMVNPSKGRRLRATLERIRWEDSGSHPMGHSL